MTLPPFLVANRHPVFRTPPLTSNPHCCFFPFSGPAYLPLPLPLICKCSPSGPQPLSSLLKQHDLNLPGSCMCGHHHGGENLAPRRVGGAETGTGPRAPRSHAHAHHSILVFKRKPVSLATEAAITSSALLFFKAVSIKHGPWYGKFYLTVG